jgi:eukaryotic-like serine/threonine-protein kinase
MLGVRMLEADVLPSRIGPYHVLSRIGVGGLCEVFLAEAYGASGFVRRVAIKRLHASLEEEPELVKALIREAQLGGVLRHRGLVGVHGLGTEAGRYFVVMEWIDGFELASLLSAGPPPPTVACALAVELAGTLDYVHRARDLDGRPLGLVHRDLSATNLLLSREGELKLTDFGLAKATLLADRSRGDVRKGTYAYMSPEQVAQVADQPLAQASDQFAFGIVLAELLTGERPFDRDSVLETMQAISEADFAAWPRGRQLAAPAVAFLRRCLARQPERRFGAMAELRAGLRELGAVAELSEVAAWVTTAAVAEGRVETRG